MNLHQSLIAILFLAIQLLYHSALGAETGPPLVEVQIAEDVLAPYLERRDSNGIMVGIDYESLVFKNFYSSEDGASYDTIFGSDSIPLVRIALDYKQNLSFGSLSIGAHYGVGSVSSALDRALEITKYGGDIKFIADTLMKEPYVAPYIGVEAWKIQTVETATNTIITKTTGIGMSYSAGVLLQLNWIDLRTANLTALNYGLENTFINLYATQYSKTQGAEDFDTTTDLLWGAGIKLEF